MSDTIYKTNLLEDPDYQAGIKASQEKQILNLQQKLTKMQNDWDLNHEDWKLNPDAYSAQEAYLYSGKRPETLEDVAKQLQFDHDSKKTAAIGLGTVAGIYAPTIIGNAIKTPILTTAGKTILNSADNAVSWLSKNSGKWYSPRHLVQTILNPKKAYTGVGEAAATTLDVAGSLYGVKDASDVTNRWISGNYQPGDVARVSMDVLGVAPIVNYLSKIKYVAPAAAKELSYMSASTNNPIVSNNNVLDDIQDGVARWKVKNAFNIHKNDIDSIDKFVNDVFAGRIHITGIDPNALHTNYYRYKGSLLQDDLYNKKLNADKLWDELAYMGLPETSAPENPDVIYYFKNDALPRLLNNLGSDNIYLPDDVKEEIIKMYSNPYDGVNNKIGYTPPGVGGRAKGGNYIRFSNRYSITPHTEAHELHHSLRFRLNEILQNNGVVNKSDPKFAIPSELQSTNPQRPNTHMHYTPLELNFMRPLATDPKYSGDLSPYAEIGATVAGDARFTLYESLKKRLGRIPTINDANDRINMVDDAHLIDSFLGMPYSEQVASKIDPKYGISIQQAMRDSNIDVSKKESMIKDYAERYRNALRYIAGFSGATYINEALNNESLNTNSDL